MKRIVAVCGAFGLAMHGCGSPDIHSADASPASGRKPASLRAVLPSAVLFTQVPASSRYVEPTEPAAFRLKMEVVDGSRIVLLKPASPTGEIRNLTPDFHGACQPDLSFDATRILFAGKRRHADRWNIWEMKLDGSQKRQITSGLGDCFGPVYLPTFYVIVADRPWSQIAFCSTAAGHRNEDGRGPASALYSCTTDGRGVRRITYNLSSDRDPFVLKDGRIVFSSWQRHGTRHWLNGIAALFTVNTDGVDFFVFFGNHGGAPIKSMPCETGDGLVVFVESDGTTPDGAGRLAAVAMRRNLHSWRLIAEDTGGLYHSPAPLSDGTMLVSYRKTSAGTHGIYRLDPKTGRREKLIYDDPSWHEVYALPVAARPMPDGRSSVVNEKKTTGKLYCLNCYLSDRPEGASIRPGQIKAVRLIEGIGLGKDVEPLPARPGHPGATTVSLTPFVQKRILGVAPVEPDGSFHLEVPANTPMHIQTLDENQVALQSLTSWIWVMPGERRGCIGCHQDRELCPENRLVDAVRKPAANLNLPVSRRRTVDFRRDVMPIIRAKCALPQCHGSSRNSPSFDRADEMVPVGDHPGYFNRAYEALLARAPDQPGRCDGKYVKPGRARASPLIWHLFGRRLDGVAAGEPVERMPMDEALTDLERQTFVEWVDLGAQWDNIPAPDAFVQGASPAPRSGGLQERPEGEISRDSL